jgi:hypothetical protein
MFLDECVKRVALAGFRAEPLTQHALLFGKLFFVDFQESLAIGAKPFDSLLLLLTKRFGRAYCISQSREFLVQRSDLRGFALKLCKLKVNYLRRFVLRFS